MTAGAFCLIVSSDYRACEPLSRLLLVLMVCADCVVESGRRLQDGVESASKLVDIDALESLVLITEVGCVYSDNYN